MKSKIIILIVFAIIFLSGCEIFNNNLTIAIYNTPQNQVYWKELITDYKKTSGEQINLVSIASIANEYHQDLARRLKGFKKDPDLYLINTAWLSYFASHEYLAPLNSHLASANVNLNKFYTNAIYYDFADNNKVLALPLNIQCGVLYYRKDLLRRYGYRTPRSWYQLVRTAKSIQYKIQKYTNPNFHGFIWQGAPYEGLVSNFLEYSGSNNGGLKFKKNKLTLNNYANRLAVNMMYNTIHIYNISPPEVFRQIKEAETSEIFYNGNALFVRDYPRAWEKFQEDNSPIKDKVAIAPLPSFPNKKTISSIDGWYLGISHNKKKAEQINKFLAYYYSPKIQKKCADKFGWISAYKETYNDKELIKKHPQYREIGKILKYSVLRPNHRHYLAMSQILQEKLSDILQDKETVYEGLKEAEKEINSQVLANKTTP